MTEVDLAERAVDDPDAVWRALDLADARDSFAAFCGMIEIPQAPLPDAEESDEVETFAPIKRESAAHIVLLQEKLQEVADGKLKRLLVFMPPGSTKSTYCSVCFPPFVMGREPRTNIILATYASDLGRKMGRRAKSIVKQPVYREIMGVGLAGDSTAADQWALENENEFMAGGIRSGMTGNRAKGLIVDDPIKGREEAESKVIRDKTWDEYRDSVRTRLAPNGWIVGILTRWHESDWAGRILPEDYDGATGWVDGQDGESWFVISIPAEADRDDDPLGRKRGEMFWPEWFPETHWAPFRRDARTWASLYQQKPRPDEGTYFPRGAFARFSEDTIPRSLRFYGTSDYAVSEGKGDFTSLRVWAVDHNLNVYLHGGWRGQASSDVWVAQQCDLIAEYRRLGGIRTWYGEAGVIQKAVEPMLIAAMRERRLSCQTVWLPSATDKATRARSAQSLVNQGRVFIRDDSDGDCFIDECVAFPAGRYDDDVDNLSLIGRVIDQIKAPETRNRPTHVEGGSVF